MTAWYTICQQSITRGWSDWHRYMHLVLGGRHSCMCAHWQYDWKYVYLHQSIQLWVIHWNVPHILHVRTTRSKWRALGWPVPIFPNLAGYSFPHCFKKLQSMLVHIIPNYSRKLPCLQVASLASRKYLHFLLISGGFGACTVSRLILGVIFLSPETLTDCKIQLCWVYFAIFVAKLLCKTRPQTLFWLGTSRGM